MNRPTTNGSHGSYVTTPHATVMVNLLGGARRGEVTLTRDEFRAVKRLYGFESEEPRESPGVQALMQAGAARNAFRHAEADGLRMLAWIAKDVPPGEDPLRHLVQLAIDAGRDVDPEDVDWASDEAER